MAAKKYPKRVTTKVTEIRTLGWIQLCPCGSEFESRREDAKYCSSTCRTRFAPKRPAQADTEAQAG